MVKSLILSLAAASALAATSANAANYTITMEEGAFYPEVTYVIPGDTVTFLNKSNVPDEATSDEDTWESGVLNPNESYSLEITPDINKTFSYASDPEKKGSFSFELAPLGEISDDDMVIGEGFGHEITD